MTTAPARAPRRYDPERKSRIIEAAIDVIAEFGVAGTTHRRIAAAADVPLGSLTYHFTGLDDLLGQAFTRHADIVMASQARTRADLLKATAQDVMTKGCITCDISTSLADAIAVMTRNRIHRIVVVEQQGNLSKAVGLLAMSDILGKYVAGK